MATYSLGQTYKKITADSTTLNIPCFAIKALGGDVVVNATAAATDSDDLSSQAISDGDVITCTTGWTSVTKVSGGGTVIIYAKT